MAFVVVGLPGLLIALLTWIVLPEPRQTLGMPGAARMQESFIGTLKVLWRKPTYRHALVGLTIYAFFAYGALIFAPAYFIQVLGVPLAQVGTAYGAVTAGAALVGTLTWGYFSDHLAFSAAGSTLLTAGLPSVFADTHAV